MRKIFIGIVLFFHITYIVGNAIPIHEEKMSTRRYPRFAEDYDVGKVEMADQNKDDKQLKFKRSVDLAFSSVSGGLLESTKQLNKADQIARLKRSLKLQGRSSERKKSAEQIDQAANEQLAKFKRSVDLLSSSSESDVSFAKRRNQRISKFKRDVDMESKSTEVELREAEENKLFTKFKRNVNLQSSSSEDSSDLSFAPREEQIAKFKRNVNLLSSSSEDSSDISFAPRNEQFAKFKRSLDANDENSIALKKLKFQRSLISDDDIDYKVEERAKRDVMSEGFKETVSSFNSKAASPVSKNMFSENNVNKIVAKRSANEDVEQSITDNKIAENAGIMKCGNNKVSKRSVCMDKEITGNVDETNKVSTSLHGNNDDNNKMLVKREISAIADAIQYNDAKSNDATKCETK